MTSLPTLHARTSYCVHLFKALTKQHHREIIPMIAPYITKDSIVVDVGAHAGQFTKIFSGMVPHGRVYAFEPGSYARSILNTVKRLKGLHNVTVVPFGLSDIPAESILHVPIKNSGSLGFGLSSLASSGGDRAEKTHHDHVSLTTLDLFFKESPPGRVDFIKADIEGWELHMLTGARDTLRQYRPAVMLEVNDNALKKAGTSQQELMCFMEDVGYSVSTRIYDDLLFLPAAA